MLTFLLEHPKLRGCREEFHWHKTGNFDNELKAYLGHLSKKSDKIPGKPNSLLVAKTGVPAIKEIASHSSVMPKELNLTKSMVDSWSHRVIAIECLCDPVKTSFSLK